MLNPPSTTLSDSQARMALEVRPSPAASVGSFEGLDLSRSVLLKERIPHVQREVPELLNSGILTM